MKTIKSDSFFVFLFLAAASLTFIAGITIWPPAARFDNLWFTIGFIIFLEALLFLKPVVLSHTTSKSAGFWVALFSFNFVYSGISLALVLFVNVLTAGKGVWVILTTLGWTVLFLFVSGLFVKTSKYEEDEELIDNKARESKQDFVYLVTETFTQLKPKLIEAGAEGNQAMAEILILEKLLANSAPGKGGSKESIVELEITEIADKIKLLSNDKKMKPSDLIAQLAALKGKLRYREKIIAIK